MMWVVCRSLKGCAEIGGLTEGTRNTEKAIDLLRTAEGAMGEISSILVRMSELATQASTDTLNDTNREAVHSEFNQLKDYIDRVAKQASYNDQNLLAGFGHDVNNLTSTAIDALADNGIRRVKLSSVEAGTYTFTDSPLTIVSPLAMAPRRRPSSSVRSWTLIMSQTARQSSPILISWGSKSCSQASTWLSNKAVTLMVTLTVSPSSSRKASGEASNWAVTQVSPIGWIMISRT